LIVPHLELYLQLKSLQDLFLTYPRVCTDLLFCVHRLIIVCVQTYYCVCTDLLLCVYILITFLHRP
jgi:hypothetical protein